MCGATVLGRHEKITLGGLSPHVRGHPALPEIQAVQAKSIPACAGPPSSKRQPSSGAQVYSRMCGATVQKGLFARQAEGLSPHVRGHPLAKRAGRRRVGSIPACAGPPARQAVEVGQVKVYPRMCGATTPSHSVSTLDRGLSPHVRGHRLEAQREDAAIRSIPACAGPPRAKRSRGFLTKVYPRMCGATELCTRHGLSLAGLSPHVRGHPAARSPDRGRAGSIPACAGPPGCRSGGRCCLWVYPRMCGATKFSRAVSCLSTGLSPHVRGHRRSFPPGHPWPGSIPACAGPPQKPARTSSSTRVYPRMCGATSASNPRKAFATGLSPHVRGHPNVRPPDVRRGVVLVGSIPACAGPPIPGRASK